MVIEGMHGTERLGLVRGNPFLERPQYKSHWRIRRFADDESYRRGDCYREDEFDGNLLLNEGINSLWNSLAGNGSETLYNNANARLGVGNGTATASATQTALQGGSTAFAAMDVSYPTSGTSQKITFRSTFGSGDANFAWEEFTVDNGATPNKNLNRKVSSQGTKASGQTWELTLEITLS